MLKLFCLITGDDYKSLTQESSASKKKVALLAIGLFIPVILWMVNALLFVNQVLEKPLFVAVITSLFMSLIIFLIEKTIIMSNGSWPIYVFRILIGLTVAILGSISLDEVVFKNDIDYQVSSNRNELMNLQNTQIDERYRKLIESKINEVNNKYGIYITSQYDVKKEADGSGGSKKRGSGIITDLKKQIASQCQIDYNKSARELVNLEADKTEEKQKANSELNTSYKPNSILIRIEAMFDLIATNKWMLGIYLVFTAFIFFLEFVVVLLKVFMKETSYEQKLRLIEVIKKKRMDYIAERKINYPDPFMAEQVVSRAKMSVDKSMTSIYYN